MPNYGQIDLGDATTIFAPPDAGEGNWVGAPCVHVHDDRTYLAVRFRNPEGRGYAVRIYERTAETTFEERVELTADELDVVSVERPALLTDPKSGDLKLYVPVDRGENDWAIRKLTDVTAPELFDPASARPVLKPRSDATDGVTVKDPYVLTVGGRYYMFYAGHDGRSEQAHLATSPDGTTWTRSSDNPLLARGGWHDHHTRISCVVPAPDCPAWLVFYEGSSRSDTDETRNLRTGLGLSWNLEGVVDASPDGPWLTAPTTERETNLERLAACRYLDVLRGDGEWEVFVEVARDDGAFELRWVTLDIE